MRSMPGSHGKTDMSERAQVGEAARKMEGNMGNKQSDGQKQRTSGKKLSQAGSKSSSVVDIAPSAPLPQDQDLVAASVSGEANPEDLVMTEVEGEAAKEAATEANAAGVVVHEDSGSVAAVPPAEDSIGTSHSKPETPAVPGKTSVEAAVEGSETAQETSQIPGSFPVEPETKRPEEAKAATEGDGPSKEPAPDAEKAAIQKEEDALPDVDGSSSGRVTDQTLREAKPEPLDALTSDGAADAAEKETAKESPHPVSVLGGEAILSVVESAPNAEEVVVEADKAPEEQVAKAGQVPKAEAPTPSRSSSGKHSRSSRSRRSSNRSDRPVIELVYHKQTSGKIEARQRERRSSHLGRRPEVYIQGADHSIKRHAAASGGSKGHRDGAERHERVRKHTKRHERHRRGSSRNSESHPIKSLFEFLERALIAV